MKKMIFYISIIISIILLVNVVKILTNDFGSLTEFGFGYLAGKVILLLIFLSIIYITRKNKIPVIVTNQVYSSFDDKDKVNMVGGDILKYSSKTLVELKCLKQEDLT